MKKFIVVTGGAGFIGSNLINKLLLSTNLNIISLDNYSNGNKKNHILNKRIQYIKSNTKEISKVLNNKKKEIKALFHFGEFSRIYQSFLRLNDCIDSNTIGTYEVFNFCLKNKIKLIYSATSATIGNNGSDKNLSPYAFTKAKNLEMLENLKKWFDFKYEVIFFYNVYGPNQIKKGSMATVIGIFEDQFSKGKPLTIVRPGTQSRRFTHVFDTVEVCIHAYKKNRCEYYLISNKKSYSILEVAKMFDSKIKYLPARPGERYESALLGKNLLNKVNKIFGKIQLKDYIADIINRNSI